METMDRNKIIEGNKLIAAFFGRGKFSYYGHNLDLYGTPHYPINKIRYHNSWDWIMPVIRKIQTLEKEFPITTDDVLSLRINEELQIVWETVVQFIKTYNYLESIKS